eukprot:GHVQ01007165.1.p1 GENE.GHVQ01007165.1~~GHVQ01007165.1.p1  ORF type:complete len:107 (+),score=22.29 GHVQ01007165.1:319-639(+)
MCVWRKGNRDGISVCVCVCVCLSVSLSVFRYTQAHRLHKGKFASVCLSSVSVEGHKKPVRSHKDSIMRQQTKGVNVCILVLMCVSEVQLVNVMTGSVVVVTVVVSA